jgi:hypothetical protein
MAQGWRAWIAKRRLCSHGYCRAGGHGGSNGTSDLREGLQNCGRA